MDKMVVVMKTHVWSNDLEKYAKKIYAETYSTGVDFYILMHTENNEISSKIESQEIKNITLTFTEADIRKTYNEGYFCLYLSNHWILMWFYRQHGHKYKYFWSMEYDVRISGPSSKIWCHQSEYDFLYTMGNHRNSRDPHNKEYVGGKLTELEKFHGFIQIARYSNKVLEYFDRCFESGENGQDELITFSLINRGKFTSSKQFLFGIIGGKWTWVARYSDYNRKLYDNLEKRRNSDHVRIFHPIKPKY